ncbi:MAG: hypothetical protein KME40_14140 [Komarekiella atlantica HA4396-MV6]|nr:hypothetical protein [Komarekiella atlantica HA4396-MV6]
MHNYLQYPAIAQGSVASRSHHILRETCMDFYLINTNSRAFLALVFGIYIEVWRFEFQN